MCRYFLDWLEEWSTGCADQVLVNSRYTASVFKDTFTSITTEPFVLYPSLDFSKFDSCPDKPLNSLLDIPRDINVLFLSINRFERKKNLALALFAFNHLVESKNPDVQRNLRKEDYVETGDQVVISSCKVHLVMAGGYDPRNLENIQHYNELLELRDDLKLTDHVTFVKSPSEELKINLLRRSDCLVYTPENEHFGIVPLEAMYCRTPVVAVSSGGPMETIENNVTGFLCPQTPLQFSEAMSNFVSDRSLGTIMGQAGHDRVVKVFSFDSFIDCLDSVISDLVSKKRK